MHVTYNLLPFTANDIHPARGISTGHEFLSVDFYLLNPSHIKLPSYPVHLGNFFIMPLVQNMQWFSYGTEIHLKDSETPSNSTNDLSKFIFHDVPTRIFS